EGGAERVDAVVHVPEAVKAWKRVEVALNEIRVTPQAVRRERLGQRVAADVAIPAIRLPVAPDVRRLPPLPEFQGVEMARANGGQDLGERGAGGRPHVDERAVDGEGEQRHQRGRRGAPEQTRPYSAKGLGRAGGRDPRA